MIRRARELLDKTFRWSERDEDSRRSLLLMGGISALVVLALGSVAVGLYVDRVAFRRDTVLEVGDRKFSYAQLERRLNAELGIVSGLSGAQFVQSVNITMATMAREELVRQVAVEQGISASEEEIENQMKDILGLGNQASKAQLAARLRLDLQDSGLSLAEFEEIAETALLEETLRLMLAEEVPAEAEQVDLRLLQVATAEEAEDARSQIDDGTELAELAATLSIHSSRSSAGEIGWVVRNALPTEVEEAAFALEAGDVSQVIEAEEGFFIVEVRAKEVREVEETARDQVVARQLGLLLDDLARRLGLQILQPTDEQMGRLAGSLRIESGGG